MFATPRTAWKTAAKRSIRHKEFLISVADSNFEKMNLLIEEGIDINFKDQDGQSPLLLAIEYADSEVFKFLIDRGANLTIENDNHETLIDIASRMNKPQIIEILLATWNGNLDNIRAKNNDALDVLNIMSYILQDKISIDFLLIFIKDKDKLTSALELLKQCSLITCQNNVYNLHRVVQQMNRMKLLLDQNEKTALKRILSSIESRCMNDKNLDHFISIWSYAKKYPELVEMYHHCPRLIINRLLTCYRISEADLIVNELAELLKQLPSENDNVRRGLINVRYNIASVMFEQGKHEEALCEFKKLYEIQKVEYGTTDVETLGTKLGIAMALTRLGDKEKALELYRDALKIETIVLGENHFKTLSTKSDMAKVLLDTNRFDEASKTLEEVYNAQKSTLGENDRTTLNTRIGMGLLLLKQNKLEAALKTFQDVHDFLKSNMVEEHPELLIDVRSEIAITFQCMKKHDKALDIYQDIFRIRKKFQDENHPSVLAAQRDIASALRQLGRHSEALKISKEILEKQRVCLGHYHRDTLESLFLIASTMLDQNQFCEALPMFKELLQVPVPLDAFKRMLIHQKIGSIMVAHKNFDKALEHLEEALEWSEGNLGSDTPITLRIRYDMGYSYYMKEDYDKALDYLNKVKNIGVIALGKDHPNYIATCQLFDDVLLAKNQSKNSARFPVEDPFVAVVNGNLSLLKKLIEKNVDINVKDGNNMTLLYYAAANGRLEIMKFLLTKGSDVTQIDKKGCSALHVAVQQGHLKIIEELLANVSCDKWRAFINAKIKKTGTTALHIASQMGFHEITRLLLTRGAIYDIKDKDGKKPVDLAITSLITMLLKDTEKLFEFARSGEEISHFNDLRQRPVSEYLALTNTRDSQGYTLMQVALVHNQPEIIKSLGDAELKQFTDICSLLVFDGNLADLTRLVNNASRMQDENYDTDVILKEVQKFVTAFRATDKRNSNVYIQMIEDLLVLIQSFKDDKSLRDLTVKVMGLYVKLFESSICSVKLYQAAKQNDWANAEACLKDANRNVTDCGGWTPLLFATNAGNKEMVKLLLENGAQVNCTTVTGKNTPLHIAVNKGHLEIVELLLERNTSSDFIDAKTQVTGSTAMHIAAKSGRLDLIILLMKNGAAYCLHNKDGKMPIDLANDELVKGLLKLVHEMFEDSKNGRTEIIEKLKTLKSEELLAISGTNNEEGFLLAHVAAAKGHRELACMIELSYKDVILFVPVQVQDEEKMDEN